MARGFGGFGSAVILLHSSVMYIYRYRGQPIFLGLPKLPNCRKLPKPAKPRHHTAASRPASCHPSRRPLSALPKLPKLPIGRMSPPDRFRHCRNCRTLARRQLAARQVAAYTIQHLAMCTHAQLNSYSYEQLNTYSYVQMSALKRCGKPMAGGGGPAARPVQGRRGHKQFFIFASPLPPRHTT
jgi:hypothetical protein